MNGGGGLKKCKFFSSKSLSNVCRKALTWEMSYRKGPSVCKSYRELSYILEHLLVPQVLNRLISRISPVSVPSPVILM